MFAPIYNCPVHGETWHPVRSVIIDTERDDVYTVLVCPQPGCSHELKPVIHEGKQVCHALSEDEAYWEMMPSGLDEMEEDYV